MSNGYILYKGNELISVGTAKEIAKELGIKERTLYHYGTPSYKLRTRGENNLRLYKIESTPIYRLKIYQETYEGTIEEIQQATGLKRHTLTTYKCIGKLKYIGERE